MDYYNISSIYEGENSRNYFNSYGGIFRITVFGNILDRLIYEDEYETVDNGLSDSNIGSRKQRNIRDNIFVLGAVCNAVAKGDAEAINICTYDIAKCLDALWLDETVNDLHDTGLQNDKLSLFYLENRKCKVAIKTPNGITERINMEDIVMQGTVWGSLKCTAQPDNLVKKAYENKVPIFPLQKWC